MPTITETPLNAAIRRVQDLLDEHELSQLHTWDEIGCWPDDWSRWQRALDDVFPVFQAPALEDLRG